MKALRMVAAAGMLTMFAWAACAQPAGEGPPPGPRARREQRPPMTPEQRADALAERLGLSAAEKTHTATALKAKREAAQQFGEALRALREAARDPKITEKQARAALAKFDKALDTHRARLRSIDSQLGKSVSAQARLKLTAVGIIDNGAPAGLRMMGGRRAGGMERVGRQPRPPAAP